VLLMMDECVGHMTEKVVIPPAGQIEILPRRYTALPPAHANGEPGGDGYLPYRPGLDGVPETVRAGRGYRFHITGLTHDEHGCPAMNVETQQKLVRRLVDKIRLHAGEIARWEEAQLDDAEVVVIAYGITARVALRAVQMARERGTRAGLLRPVVVWPFPEKRIRDLAGRLGTRRFVVAEMNLGQMVLEVERAAAGRVPVVSLTHAGGTVHRPEEILAAILEEEPREDRERVLHEFAR